MTELDPRVSDTHAVLVELLSDGEWHDYHVILAKAAKTVQPGAAIRQCEDSRARRSKMRTGEVKPRVKPLSIADQIRVGSRQIIQARLLNRAFEIDPPGVQPPNVRKRVRLRPKPSATEILAKPDPRWSPQLAVALELLADGQWHDFEEVLGHAMQFVSEERALHQVSLTRSTGPQARGSDREQAVRTGRRALAYRALMNNRRLEVDNDGTRKRIRLKPGTP